MVIQHIKEILVYVLNVDLAPVLVLLFFDEKLATVVVLDL